MLGIVNHLSTLLAGFSVFSCLILWAAYLFFLPDMRKTSSGKLACSLLLGGLCLLQIAHYSYFNVALPVLEYRAYGALLMAIPPSFYFFSREVLFDDVRYSFIDCLHAIPIIFLIVLPVSVLPAVAFLFGTGYTFWFARLVFKLRGQRGRFKFEMFFFGMFAVMALFSLLLGLALPKLDPFIFYTAYSNAISFALLLIVSALLFFPELLSDILLIAELAYAKSKLGGVDTELKLQDLDRLMSIEKHFQDEDLSLGQLSELLGLSPHQLSELINSHFGFGFPRYIREQRVREAKRLLLDEGSASVLSISMMTGFRSQSNFYTAFKEITGYSPGQYRKKYS